MTTRQSVRVGIVGAGGIAQYYHVPQYLRCGDVQIVAICDVSDVALEQIKVKCGAARLYHAYQEMLERENLDLISICTSNDMHHPVALAAMAQGIDIYCEKPLALNYAQAQEMYAAAQARGIKTGVNFSHRRTPAAQLAREIVASGALGRIHYASAVYAAGGANYAQHKGTWRNEREKAGFGGMGDMGAHMLDMLMWWLDSEITSVTAQTCTVVPEVVSRDTGKPMQVTTEDQGMLLLSYANGALGYLYGGYVFTGRGYDQRVEIYGTEGGLMYNQQHPTELKVCLPADFLKRYEVLRQGGAKDTPYTTIHVPERLQGLLPNEPGAGRSVLMDFMDAYRAEGPFSFRPGFYEGMKVQEVLEASRRAEASRCWVSLPLECD